jgi:hypothetical protein
MCQYNLDYYNDESLWECNKNDLYVIGIYDILTNMIVTPRNVIFINSKHHLHKQHIEQIMRYIK